MMAPRRTQIALVAVAALAVIAFIIWMLIKSGATGGEESPTPEVAVHVGKIVKADLHRFITGYGSVEPEPATEGRPAASALVASPIAGILADVKCTEGQSVTKGTPLFMLDSRVADVALERAKKTVEFAEVNFERQKMLIQNEGTSQKLYQEAEQQRNTARNDLAAAQTQLALLRIDAPLTGTLARVLVKPGEAVETTTVLAELIDLNRLVVTTSVPSREARSLKLGQPVKFGVGRIPEEKMNAGSESETGTLTFIGSQIDLKTDSVMARASVPAGSGLRPGQFLNLRIVCEEHADCLAVPEESVITGSAGVSAIMLVEGDKAIEKEVRAGFRESGLVEIEGEGLKEGIVVVTEGAYGLPSQTRIRIIGQ
jgi:membrane fusion protein (multidrug efflux system)